MEQPSPEPTTPRPLESDESGSSKLDLKRIRNLSRPEWGTLALGTLALIIATGTGLTAPTLVGHLVDGVTEGNGREALDQAALLLLGVFAIGGLAAAFRSYLFTVAGERVVARLRVDLYTAVIQQEIGFFDLRRTGELTNRLASSNTSTAGSLSNARAMAIRCF